MDSHSHQQQIRNSCRNQADLEMYMYVLKCFILQNYSIYQFSIHNCFQQSRVSCHHVGSEGHRHHGVEEAVEDCPANKNVRILSRHRKSF